MNKIDFLTILSIHRDQIRDHHQSPGWNRWALVGALASLIWLFLSLYSEDKINFQDGALICILILWCEPLLRMITSFLDGNSQNGNNSYRLFSKEVSTNIYSNLFSIVLFGGIVYITNFHLNISGWFLTLINVYQIVMGLFLILLIIIIRFDVPVPEDQNKNPITRKSRNFAIVVFSAITLLVIYALLSSVQDLYNVQSIKSALIFYAAIFVLRLLLRTYEGNTMLDNIENLIDDITFEKTSIEEGEDQLRLILLGLEFKHIIAPYAVDFINCSHNYQTAVEFTKIRVNQYISTDNKELKAEYKKGVTRNIEQVNHYNKALGKAGGKLKRKLQLFHAYESGKDDFKSQWHEFENVQEKNVKKYNELMDLFNSVLPSDNVTDK